jgi:hypothetical protein
LHNVLPLKCSHFESYSIPCVKFSFETLEFLLPFGFSSFLSIASTRAHSQRSQDKYIIRPSWVEAVSNDFMLYTRVIVRLLHLAQMCVGTAEVSCQKHNLLNSPSDLPFFAAVSQTSARTQLEAQQTKDK